MVWSAEPSRRRVQFRNAHHCYGPFHTQTSKNWEKDSLNGALAMVHFMQSRLKERELNLEILTIFYRAARRKGKRFRTTDSVFFVCLFRAVRKKGNVQRPYRGWYGLFVAQSSERMCGQLRKYRCYSWHRAPSERTESSEISMVCSICHRLDNNNKTEVTIKYRWPCGSAALSLSGRKCSVLRVLCRTNWC